VAEPTFPVLFRTLETVAVETSAAFATSRMVTLMIEIPGAENGRSCNAETARSIDEEKILDNAVERVIFPEHTKS
jgi:hypothetical protein